MGLLFYGSSERPIRIPDRVLAHVKVVIATKLRRGESFTMSWRHPDGEEGGRSTIWIQQPVSKQRAKKQQQSTKAPGTAPRTTAKPGTDTPS
ncbi:hypothetical protein [Microbacterium sp. B19]|uniref:DUF7882 family protein n=1 Tax=Microbacterium sp. B19 TaxID=96765 RepID=UPI0003467209|nr:hypothetical protein [Microbacterium sp. B19]